MKKLFSNNVFLSLFIALLCILISQFIFCAAYDTNDGMLLEVITSGVLTGSPNPFLYNTSTIIGRILTSLYSLTTYPNWYYIILISYYCLFVALFLYFVSGEEINKKKPAVFVVAVLGIYIMVKPQYTEAAILLSFCAFLYLLRGIKRWQVRELACGFSLLILSVLIRHEIIFIFLVLFFLPLLYVAYINKRIKFSIVLIFVIALLFVNNFLEKKEMSNLVGYDIREYVHATEIIIDKPTNVKDEDLAAIDWSYSALMLMESFFFIESEVFSFEKMSKFSKLVTTVNDPAAALKHLNLKLPPNYPLLILLLIFILLSRNFYTNKVLLYVLLASTFLVFYLSFDLKLPNRVLVPLLILNILLFFILGDLKSRFRLIYAGTFIIALFLFKSNYNDSVKHEKLKLKADKSLEYFNANPDKIFQLSYRGFPYIGFAGFKNKFHNHPCNILGFGWLIGTPAYYEHLKRYDIENHAFDLFTRDDILFIANDFRLRDNLKDFARYYYNLDIEYTLVSRSPMEVYKINKIR